MAIECALRDKYDVESMENLTTSMLRVRVLFLKENAQPV